MKKIIIIAVVAVVLIGGGIAAFLILGSNSDKPEPAPEELFYKVPEGYTNIPLGDEAGTYKILKYQLTIVYTNAEFTELLPKKQDDIIDFINGYFRDKTLDTVNRKNGKERIKEEIAEQLREMLETDSDNILRVLMPQFIIQ